MLKGDSIYSINWKAVKIIPKNMVHARLHTVVQVNPLIILRWHKDIVIPEDNKIIVFNNGNPQGLKGCIPIGGQTLAIKIEGFKLE